VDKTTQIFVVEAGQEFEIQVMGSEASVADPTGIINGITYRYRADSSGLTQLGQAYRSVPSRIEGRWMLERKPL
jgi:hypothetical protein